jgi:hypothetical protein
MELNLIFMSRAVSPFHRTTPNLLKVDRALLEVPGPLSGRKIIDGVSKWTAGRFPRLNSIKALNVDRVTFADGGIHLCSSHQRAGLNCSLTGSHDGSLIGL